MHPGRVWLEVSGEKIRSNVDKIRSYVQDSMVVAVLKADAYGVGIDLMLKVLKDSSISAIAVAESEQAQKVKQRGFPVYMLGALTKVEIETIVKGNVDKIGFASGANEKNFTTAFNEIQQLKNNLKALGQDPNMLSRY